MKEQEQQTATGGAWDWDTGVAGLVRHRNSGRYYSRFQLDGKRTMKALKTDDFGRAKVKHFELMAKVERQRQIGVAAQMGKGTMGELLALAADVYAQNTELSLSSKTNFRINLERLQRHWVECFGRDIATQKPDKITGAMAERFANYLHTQAQWRRHKMKGSRKGYGAVTVNVTIETLHRVLRFGRDRGYLLAVPFELDTQLGQGGVRKSEPRKKIEFPSASKIAEVFRQMRTIRDDLPENQNELRAYLVKRAQESGDLAEFMAYSGARLMEAVTWTWEDEREEIIFIRGTKTETSKDRAVPKLAAMRDLLSRMKARRLAEGRGLKGRAFTIKECREALESACKRAGVERWTHHSLRHLFATRCIEAGVDIPTVSRWLGHADGGTLAMMTYGHLRQEHSLAQAAKVSFGVAA